MTISQAIQRLTKLRDKHGDIDIAVDCAFCGKSTTPTVIVIGAPVVRMQTQSS